MAAAASAQEMRIQFAEPVGIAAVAGTSEFDAYGRRFVLELASNDRLIAKLPAQRKAAMARYRLFRGTLSGQPDSWVRLTEFGGRLEGAIWDGHDLYAVTRYSEVAHALSTPIPAAPDQTVVFRLSDTVNAFPQSFCGVIDSEGGVSKDTNALNDYKSMIGEIRANALGTPVSKQMDIALIADRDFQEDESADVTGAMLARLNTADGIFADQVGLLLNASQVVLVPAGNDPFTTSVPQTLLDQVSTYRAATPVVRAAAIAHLITGKSLTEDTLGIATISGVCKVDGGVSLSVGWRGSFFSGLIMAHELGHNLGAVHDGAPGVCQGVGPGYIMWPRIDDGARRFSQCSVSSMRAVIDTSSCLTPAAVADVTATLSLSQAVGELQVPMTLTANVSSVGALLAQNASISFNIPGNLNATAITTTGGTCTLSPSPNCALGDMATSEQRTVIITATPLAVTPQITVTATATATNDRVENNDLTFTDFAVVNNADASMTVSPTSATVRTGDPVDYTIRIESLRTQPVRSARLSFTPLGLYQVTYTPSTGTCTIFGDCTLGDIAPGSVITVAVHGVAYSAGTYSHYIRLDSLNDTDGNNNSPTFNLTINPTYNLEISGTRGTTVINVGDRFTTQFTVRNTLGTQSVTNATVRIFADAWAPIQEVSVPGGTCVIESVYGALCQLGSLSPGDTRTVSVTVLGAMVGSGQVSGRVAADRDEVLSDNDITQGLSVRNPVDLRVSPPYWVERVESRSAVDTVPVYSNSTLPATNFVATIELPATARLTSLTMVDTVCTIVDAQHGRCTSASLPHQMSREMRVGAIGDSPGLHRVKVVISATSEADATDNTAEFDMRVGSYADVGVTPISLPQYVFLGQIYDFETRLRTSYRDVPNVNFSVSYPVGLAITAPAELTGCVTQRSVDNRNETLLCQMPSVAANTDRLLRFQLRPYAHNDGGTVYVQALASYDVDWSNNEYHQSVLTVEPAEVSLAAAAASAAGNVGSPITLPRITLRSQRDSYGMVVRVPIPSFATVQSVSSGWTCTGTTTLECNVFALLDGTETSFDITLNASQAGTFNSRVEVVGANDSNTANNVADIAITANAVTVTPPVNPPSTGGGGSSSGGGGGGRIEWMLLALLGGMAARRAVRVRRTI